MRPQRAILVVFVLYIVVLRHWAASRAAYGFVLVPFVTVVLSAWLDDEPVRRACCSVALRPPRRA
jgi:hypothetical protein